MRMTPGFLGALSLVLVTGVASGAMIGAVPPMRQVALGEMLPQASAQPAWPAEFAQRLPDHYPIVTPEGRFEVAELSDRGLYRNARYARDYYAHDTDEPEPYAHDEALAELAWLEPEPVAPDEPDAAPRADAADAAAMAGAPAEPLPAEPGPAVAAAGPRTIDVAAELAARQ